MKAGIIAAGWGERLGQKIPKALTPVGGRPLIDFVLDGLEAAGAESVVCIVNDAATAVPEHVRASGRRLPVEWIVRTTPSSMHSFLIVLERLSASGDEAFLMTTVDSVCSAEVYRRFAQAPSLFPQADVVLGLTNHIDDEKPLRVAMAGEESTGLLPGRVEENPEAFEIVALTNTGFDSEFVTSGFYWVKPGILREKETALSKNFTALRQFLGHLLKYGHRFYGLPLPPVIDVDRPADIQAAERLLKR
jgi:NDP-sugar pyrophosphorylase family protein